MSNFRELIEGRWPDVATEITEDGLFGVGEIDANQLDETEGFLLVERGADGQSMWFTVHDTPDSAAAYHDNQEGAEWWADCQLIDVRDGETFTGVAGDTKWVRR